MLKPIRAKIASLGIRHSIYMDDGHVMGTTIEETYKALLSVYDILQKAGFKLALDKSDTKDTITQSKEYLGFTLHSQDMTITVPDKKKCKVKQVLEEEIAAVGKWRKAKDVASTVGKVIALEPALGPVVQLLTRVIQRDLTAAVDIAGW